MQYFILDQHFFHSNILSFRDTQDRPQRPFKTLAEMHDRIISRHNEVITSADTVYHLGDFFFGRSWQDAQNILKRLKGKHVLSLVIMTGCTFPTILKQAFNPCILVSKWGSTP